MTPEEVMGKIESEGGVSEAFLGYGLVTGIEAIDLAARKLRIALGNLEQALYEAGIEY